MMTALLNVLRLSQCGWAVMALVLSLAADGNAQSQEWLLGMWSGTFRISTLAGGSNPATLTIRDEAGTLKWTWTGTPRMGTAVAEGIVTKFDASSVELEGKFVSHWVPVFLGTGFRMSLTGSPSALSGSSISERSNTSATQEFTKGK
jgi:hypothetical protein